MFPRVLLLLANVMLAQLTQAAALQMTIAVLGATGAGKSTLINAAFDVPQAVSGEFDSTTSQVAAYTSGSKALPLFADSMVFDTPGLMDNRGVSDREVLDNITSFYLKQKELDVSTARIDAFLLLNSVMEQRVYLEQNLGAYISAFSPSMLKSLVVVNTLNNVLHKPPEYMNTIRER
ncbi:DUF697 domain-containing protein, partial [Balamuthia mandrillaris]